MTPSLPPPEKQPSAKEARDTGAPPHARKTRAAAPPDPTTILLHLQRLTGMVLMGMIQPACAKVIQGNLKIMLDAQLKQAVTGAGTGHLQETLMELCRRDPAVLAVVEPFLTDEQVRWITENDEDHEDEA